MAERKRYDLLNRKRNIASGSIPNINLYLIHCTYALFYILIEIGGIQWITKITPTQFVNLDFKFRAIYPKKEMITGFYVVTFFSFA